MEILGDPADGPADRGPDRSRDRGGPVFEASLDEPVAGHGTNGFERVNGFDRAGFDGAGGFDRVRGPGSPVQQTPVPGTAAGVPPGAAPEAPPHGPVDGAVDDAQPAWSLARLAGSVLTAEALGLTGVVLVLGALVGFPSPYLWADTSGTGPVFDPRAQVDFVGRASGLLALLALASGCGAVLRLGPRPSAAARALAGAAVVLGALLLLYAGALLWRYSGLPEVQPPVDAL